MYILPALVSSLSGLALLGVAALAHPDADQVTVHKRDAPLAPRDLELAAINNVDLERMYKHTSVKRSDDEEWTIWVHKSFQESQANETDVAPGLQPRQLRARPIAPFFRSREDRQCHYSSTLDDETTSGSPTTGGTQEMQRWADSRNNMGFFDLDSAFIQANGNVDLIVAGSNGGANAVFIAKKHPLDFGRWAYVGTYDIYWMIDAANKFQRKINGKWRLGVHGGVRCGPWLGPFDQGAKVDWWISWTSQRA